MGIRIKLSESQVLELCKQIAYNLDAGEVDKFAEWFMVEYVGNNYSIEGDLEEALTNSRFDLCDAMLNSISDNPFSIRRKYFRHCHRDFLIHPSQVYALLQAGREVWVSDSNSDDEIDMFTTVSWDDFANSDAEWEEWIEWHGLYAMDPNN